MKGFIKAKTEAGTIKIYYQDEEHETRIRNLVGDPVISSSDLIMLQDLNLNIEYLDAKGEVPEYITLSSKLPKMFPEHWDQWDKRTNEMNDDYIHYGKDWEEAMMSLSKDQLIELLKYNCKQRAQLEFALVSIRGPQNG